VKLVYIVIFQRHKSRLELKGKTKPNFWYSVIWAQIFFLMDKLMKDPLQF